MNKKILLIDGNSLFYRAFFATQVVQKDRIFNSKNIPVNAIRTFCTMIQKAYKNYNPSYILIAFDAGSKTKRHDKLKEYKANRQKTPEALLQQIPIVKNMLDIMGIKHFEKEYEEADDIIASATKQFDQEIEFNVLSSDKDLYQLVSGNVKVINPQNGIKKDKIVEANNFLELNDFTPEQVCDYKGLAGDSSDNLQGVKGVGPKQSIKLLKTYKTLENIYLNIDQINGSLKEKLIKDKEIAFLCKEIAKLNFEVKIPFKMEELLFDWKPNESWVDFFKKYEIFSLVKAFSKEIDINQKTNYDKISF